MFYLFLKIKNKKTKVRFLVSTFESKNYNVWRGDFAPGKVISFERKKCLQLLRYENVGPKIFNTPPMYRFPFGSESGGLLDPFYQSLAIKTGQKTRQKKTNYWGRDQNLTFDPPRGYFLITFGGPK